MTIGVLKEPAHETRVSLLAEAVATLTKKNITVVVENGAGEKAFNNNSSMKKQERKIKERNDVLQSADIILSIHTLETSNLTASGGGTSNILVGFYQPLYNIELMKEWAAKGITAFSLDMLPRTTRAQTIDVLSSQANIAGIKQCCCGQSIQQIFSYADDGGRKCGTSESFRYLVPVLPDCRPLQQPVV
jgi:NAD(P) transhydrogenase subunit alpha